MNPERGECGYHLARLHSVRDTERIRSNDESNIVPTLVSCGDQQSHLRSRFGQAAVKSTVSLASALTPLIEATCRRQRGHSPLAVRPCPRASRRVDIRQHPRAYLQCRRKQSPSHHLQQQGQPSRRHNSNTKHDSSKYSIIHSILPVLSSLRPPTLGARR